MQFLSFTRTEQENVKRRRQRRKGGLLKTVGKLFVHHCVKHTTHTRSVRVAAQSPFIYSGHGCELQWIKLCLLICLPHHFEAKDWKRLLFRTLRSSPPAPRVAEFTVKPETLKKDERLGSCVCEDSLQHTWNSCHKKV